MPQKRMISKIKRYFTYLTKFISSPDKKALFSELNTEIKNKGLTHGIKSFLHKKMHAKGNQYQGSRSFQPFVLKKYDQESKVILPSFASPKVSVIIPMYNQAALTADCIYSIYLNSGFDDYEVIIANDNSTDDINFLKENFINLRVINNQTNLGFLKNCNHAATQARGEYLVFLNNDTYVLENWLSELFDVFTRFNNVGIAGSKLVYPDGRLQEAGGIIWHDGSAWNFGNGDDPACYEYNYVKGTDYLSGASLMIPKKIWDEVGGFDEQFVPAYCEDSDLCFKVRANGYKVLYEPYSVVVHFEGATHGINPKKGIKQYQMLNQQRLLSKWQPEIGNKAHNGDNLFYERDRSNGRKHIMVVDHYLPQVDKDAGSRTISNFMHVLIELGYAVQFLGENQNLDMRYQKYYQQQGIEVLYGTEFNFFNHSWKAYLLEHLNDIDAFLLSRSSVCVPMLAFLRSIDYKGKIIYYGHDLGFVRLENEARANNDNDLAKQARKIKDAEDYMYQNSDYALVISIEETAYLKQYIKTPLKYVPPYYFDVQPQAVPIDKKEGLLFVGGFNHPPNQDAMKWFLEEIYAPLHEQGIKLFVVGSKMPAFIYDYQAKFPLLEVRPDASVDDLNELYDRVRLAIVPLRFGAGVKGKVIEAMAKGIPVVGTSVAFEGMPKDETYLYRGADSADSIIESINKAYFNPELWQQLSWFGKKYVSDNFNKEIMKRVFKDIIG